MKYIIISGEEEEVIKRVNTLLSEGWKLYGNIICTNVVHSDKQRGYVYSNNLFTQAMIKDD